MNATTRQSIHDSTAMPRHEGSTGLDAANHDCLPDGQQPRQESPPSMGFVLQQERMQTPMERQEQEENVLLLTDTNLARHDLELGLTSSNSTFGSSSDLYGAKMARDERLSSSDPGFADVAMRNGLQTCWTMTRVPDNLASIQAVLISARDEEPPSEAWFQEYRFAVAHATNETGISSAFQRFLWNFYGMCGPYAYVTKFDIRFTLVPQDVGFNNDAAPPQPDIVQGFVEAAFDKDHLNSVEGAVPHRGSDSSVALPHLTGELKARSGNMVQAQLQSCYAGAALLWARHNTLDFLGRSELDEGLARVFTFTCNGTYLEVFACLRVKTDNGRVEYHQYLLEAVGLIATYDGFKTGWTILRNLQDLAKKEASELRDLLSKTKSATSRPSHADGQR